MVLLRVQGPECPRCGCEDAVEVAWGTRWGRATTKCQCRNCGRYWWANTMNRKQISEPVPMPTAEENKSAENGRGVVYHQVHCPKCDSVDTRVTSTRRPVRYHRCMACKHTFKSVEQ